MELVEKLRRILEEEFHITTDRQLARALDTMEDLDIGIFTIPLKGEANAKTA